PDGEYSSEKLPMSRETTLVLEILDSLQEEFSIDPARLYVSGQSMGGRGTWDIILRRPNLFAAAVPVCGSGDPSEAKRIAHMPIWNFHGSEDGVVPTQGSRDMVAALKKEGSKVIYSELEGVNHGSWIPAWETKELIPWLFKQRSPNHGKAQSSIKPRQQAERQGQRGRGPGARGPGGRGQGKNFGQEGWSNGAIPNPDGGVLDYQLCNPPQLKPNEKYPVILSMGGTSAPRSLYYPDDWRLYPAYIVIPSLPARDPIYGFAAIKVLIESLPQVDLDRVYIMGWSIGGERTTNFIREFPNFFAAATQVAGGGLTREVRTPFDAELVKHLPIWAFHGDKDPICSYQYMKDNFNDAAAVGGNFKLTTWVGARHAIGNLHYTYDGGPTSVGEDAFPAINECSTPGVCDEEMVYVKWLFKQNRKNQNPTTNSITAKPQTKNN
ncbi:MAG: prolyl oligopeptidase family serine peptidase, partial [Methanosarcinaceae archaeon]|nr:prolyl oligopeptidase family serine peptidase [Methanosarcinaceae archaeon]